MSQAPEAANGVMDVLRQRLELVRLGRRRNADDVDRVARGAAGLQIPPGRHMIDAR